MWRSRLVCPSLPAIRESYDIDILTTFSPSVNVFFRINQEHRRIPSPNHNDSAVDPLAEERAKQEHEFQIGSIGFADSSGILLASLLSMPTEIGLCRAQVARGKMLCSEL